MAEKKTKPSNFERNWNILEYLRKNTDAEHPVRSLSALLKECEKLGKYISVENKDTFKTAVWNMANALNSDMDEHMLPQDQWKLVYDAYLEKFGATDETDSLELAEDKSDGEAPEETSGKRKVDPPVNNLFYRHTFSYDEISSLIEGVLFSRTLSSRQANLLVKKIKENLTSKFYPEVPEHICKVRETVPVNWERLWENLLLLQRAIDSQAKIAFRFNGYNRDRNLVAVHEEKDVVSPYYCVAYGGRYYLLACQEKQRETGPERRMSIWRIDLMSEMEYLEERALKKEEVADLPREWNETSLFHHLNMSYDRPIPITLRIINPRHGQGGKMWTNYTFLVDWFGDTFRYEQTETEPPYGDIVRVTCSSFGMVNWALQYSDQVEVLEPQSVRDQVIKKIRKLNGKYGMRD